MGWEAGKASLLGHLSAFWFPNFKEGYAKIEAY